MKLPKTPRKRGFSIRIILGFIFIFFGIIVLLELFKINFIKDSPIIINTLKYGTALGSLIGGLFMLFRKKETPSSQIRI
jgi:hypothetical protein